MTLGGGGLTFGGAGGNIGRQAERPCCLDHETLYECRLLP